MANGGSGDYFDEIENITSKTAQLDIDLNTAGYVAFILNSKGTSGQVLEKVTGVATEKVFDERLGAKKDEEYFKNLFVDKLGLDWINEKMFKNLKVDHWDHSIMGATDHGSEHESFSVDCCLRCNILSRDYSSCRFFVLVASSHGYEEQEPKILMSDGSSLLLSEITEVLRDVRLDSVTKILILQACRTDLSEVQPGAGASDGAASSTQDKRDDKGVTTFVRKDDATSREKSPDGKNDHEGEDQANAPTLTPSSRDLATTGANSTARTLKLGEPPQDFLIVYATTKGRRSYNHEQGGSWMLNCLDEVISNETRDKFPANFNFLNLLTKTNGLVCEMETMQWLRDAEGKVVFKDGKRVRDENKIFKNTMCVSHRLRNKPVFDLGVAASRLEERRRQKSKPDLPGFPEPLINCQEKMSDGMILDLSNSKKKKRKKNLAL